MSAPTRTLAQRGQRVLGDVLPQLLDRQMLYVLPADEVWILWLELTPTGEYRASLSHGCWDEIPSPPEVIAKVRAFAAQVTNALLVLVESGSEQYQEVVSWSAYRVHPKPVD